MIRTLVEAKACGKRTPAESAQARLQGASLPPHTPPHGGLVKSEAAAVGISYLAAWSAPIDAAEIQAGETVLVTGALGAVGQAA